MLLLLACSTPEPASEPEMDMLVLTAPAADGHPPWQLELVLPNGANDRYSGEQIIAPLIGALQGPLGSCWKADDLQLTGSLVVDSDLVFDGKGSASLTSVPTATPLGKCVIAAFDAAPPTGLPSETWRGSVRVRFTDEEAVSRQPSAVSPTDEKAGQPDGSP